jgi:hypothetical protein
LQRSIARIEGELPPTLAQFSRRIRVGLGDLEKRLERAGAVYRRRGTRLLREASHQLGRFEAEGELRWRRLTARARREASQLLHRLERELGPPARAARKAGKARRAKAVRRARKAARKVRGAARKAVRKVRRKIAKPPRRRRAARRRKAVARRAVVPAPVPPLEAVGTGI